MTFDRRAVLAGGLSAAVMTPRSARARDAAAFEAALDAVFADTAPPALAGGVVGPAGLVWSGVRGVRRAGGDDPATADDRWHLGSNTKAMTAAVYGRLVEQGRAAWDAPLERLFPGVAADPAWAGTTLPDFLSHRAGLRDAEVLGLVFLMTARADPRPLAQQRRALVEQALGRPPGGPRGTFEYGNANYVLAGAAIEAITGRPWEDVIRAELFQPLGLASAGFGAPTQNAAGGANAWGHRGQGAARAAVDPADPGADNPLALGPAGTVHMTLGDYARWLRVFLNDGDGWLGPETLTALTTPDEGPGAPYARGWIAPVADWAGGRALAHEGSNTLWHAAAAVAPARGLAFVALSNVGAQEGVAGALMRRLIAAAG